MRLGAKLAIALLCIAGGLTAAATYRWPVRSAAFEAQVNRTVSPRLGLHVGRPASATFALLPWPTIRVVGVDLLDAQDRSVLSAPAAKFPLSLANLLRGRVVPLGASLRNPTALIDLDAAPIVAEARAVAHGQDEEPPALWSHVRLHGGVLRVISAARRFDTLIEGIGGTLDWPAADRPLQLSLVGAWRDETVKIEGKIDNPREGLLGRSTGLRMSVAARPATLNVEGSWSGGVHGGFAGDVSADIRSVSALKRLLGARPTALFGSDALSIEGKMQTTGASVALSDAHITVAGQGFEGAVTLSREGERNAISGSLAADTVQIDPLLPHRQPLLDEAGWSAQAFSFAPPKDLDLDLRISAAHAEWSGHRFDDAAVSLMCLDGRLTARLLEATAYEGTLRAELALDKGAAGLDAHMSASLADADLGAALGDFGWSAYQGKGGFDVSLEAKGASPAVFVASLAGKGSLDLESGRIQGVNIEEAIRRSQRRPIDIPRDMGTGETTFSHAHAPFVIEDGKATVASARIDGPGAAVTLDGDVDLTARKLHAHLVATQADAAGSPSADGARLTIFVDRKSVV
ncbi:MAG: AsmA family protein [Hyphomicrobiales bacterium]|nr:AsmA family protein [Hyphomicrobiales bacterium]